MPRMPWRASRSAPETKLRRGLDTSSSAAPRLGLGVILSRVSERFKRNRLTGWIRSSEGFSIRVRGRTGIDYRDELGEICIDSECLSKPWNAILVYTGSIADTPERPRAQVLERLQRAFDHAGFILEKEHAYYEDAERALALLNSRR